MEENFLHTQILSDLHYLLVPLDFLYLKVESESHYSTAAPSSDPPPYHYFPVRPPGAGGDAAGGEAAPPALGLSSAAGGDVSAAAGLHATRPDLARQRGRPPTGAV